MPENLSLEQVFGATQNLISKLVKQNNIEMDSYDRESFDGLTEASTEIHGLVNQKSGSPTWSPLLRDIWASFYKVAPELTPKAQVEAPYMINRAFVEKVMQDSSNQLARVNTVLDELVSGMATLEAGRRISKEIKDRPDIQKVMDKADRASQALQQAQEQRKKGEEGEAQKLEQQAQEMMAQTQQDIQNACKDLRMVVRRSMEAGQKKADQVVSALAGWGMEPGELTSVPLTDRIKLVQRCVTDNRLRTLADLVGRFRNLARAKQKEKIKRDRDEICGVTSGNDLPRILPVELANLRHPVMRLDFLYRYRQAQLLQYEVKTKEKMGRGPIICAVDISGSMSGQPLDWAIATALALVDTAARQKRQSAVVFFDTQVKKVIEFKPGERDLNKYADMASTGAAGGTAYNPPLNWATDKIKEIAFEKADLVMVTDGLCYLDESFLRDFNSKKEALKFNAYTVLIGSDPGGELKKWSDHVWTVNRLDEETAGEIFQEVY